MAFNSPGQCRAVGWGWILGFHSPKPALEGAAAPWRGSQDWLQWFLAAQCCTGGLQQRCESRCGSAQWRCHPWGDPKSELSRDGEHLSICWKRGRGWGLRQTLPLPYMCCLSESQGHDVSCPPDSCQPQQNHFQIIPWPAKYSSPLTPGL